MNSQTLKNPQRGTHSQGKGAEPQSRGTHLQHRLEVAKSRIDNSCRHFAKSTISTPKRSNNLSLKMNNLVLETVNYNDRLGPRTSTQASYIEYRVATCQKRPGDQWSEIITYISDFFSRFLFPIFPPSTWKAIHMVRIAKRQRRGIERRQIKFAKDKPLLSEFGLSCRD